ncbi:MAG: acetyl-CoA carboxylase biotin carboxylase subunit [Planctomycetota bacterium]
MFRKLMIANRGEIALRVITTARRLGIRTVAVCSTADRPSPHLEAADEVVTVGPAKSAQSYLDADAILMAAELHDCQAVHPGFGFLSENALFAERCAQHKLTFVGPTAEALRTMGDKSTARKTMQAAGMPLIPGSAGNLRDAADARETAARIGYPVIVKATAGGGGKGMRVCNNDAELAKNFAEASAEAEKAFGNAALYMEKYIAAGRHIEFQVLADAFGHVIHLGERECSVQRRHQKLIEESPSPAVTPAQREQMGETIVAALKRIGYRNAGTIEMLMDPQSGELYFMEMNTRLQVEHPVTEMLTGIDIVAWQLRIAANQPLTIRQSDVRFDGHAIECRINAEDPADNFRPAPGTLTAFAPPPGAGAFTPDIAPGADGCRVRVDSHVRAGYTIPPHYDSMIGKLIVHAPSRAQAIDRMHAALGELKVEGVPTTIPLHQRVLREAPFASGAYNTRFLEDLLA